MNPGRFQKLIANIEKRIDVAPRPFRCHRAPSFLREEWRKIEALIGPRCAGQSY